MSDRSPSPPTPSPRDEQTVYGVRAALALLTHRPQAVRRIFHGPALRNQLGPHLAAAAKRRIPYRELDPDSLAKAAGSPHHEGVVVVAEPLRYRPLEPTTAEAGTRPLWLVLDGVENPHNLGALLRTAAFFGLAGVLAGGVTPGEKVNAAVIRVAEGGAEWVPLYGAPSLPSAMGQLRAAGCRVLGLETDGDRALGEALTASAPAVGLALVLGQEHAGLTHPVRSACDELCRLVGAGPMDSLNVSVAAAVALAEVTHALPPSGDAAPFLAPEAPPVERPRPRTGPPARSAPGRPGARQGGRPPGRAPRRNPGSRPSGRKPRRTRES